MICTKTILLQQTVCYKWIKVIVITQIVAYICFDNYINVINNVSYNTFMIMRQKFPKILLGTDITGSNSGIVRRLNKSRMYVLVTHASKLIVVCLVSEPYTWTESMYTNTLFVQNANTA